MPSNERLIRGAASFKKSASSEFDKAVAALITLAYGYIEMGEDFLWEGDPDLYDEAMEICRNLSDTLAEKAKAIARGVFEESLDDYDFDEAWDRGNSDEYIPILTRFDMEGSHLLELLAIWIAIAFVNDIPKGELRVLVSRYLSNPFTSTLWKGLPKDALKWGRGYSRNIVDQMSIIGQNAIVSAYRYAEWRQETANGATYYIRRRGSNYDCPDCDSLCGYKIPIYEPFDFIHSRCMCWPEYHYD